ncbi:lipoprotein N-acyltransferase Lnb domain-containing protein [Solimonas flava]|uniref:lipoprotein N-acyltransferase Lnb domain-containing protein n=1 Tax=Solimonas flava TaxID=415849 RepID=UPI000686BB56|nr:DUF4105 domain-containing protein [Solimonas flava]
MRSSVYRCLALLCLALAAPLFAQAPAAAAAAPATVDETAPSIELITFGPGPIYWERFGHNAILVRQPGSSRGLLYNYGMFDFGQKNFFLNFARGYMQYRLAVQRFPQALDGYAQEARWVYFQSLDLPPEARRELAAFLAWNAEPEHAEYRYDYFIANCSTRVRDALDVATGGALKRQSEGLATQRSYRFEATRLIGPDLVLALGMDLGMGPAADRPIDLWQQSFVPMVLMDAVRKVQLSDADGRTHPLVSREGWLLQSDAWPEPAAPPAALLPLLAAGLAIGALLVLLDRARRRAPARWAFALLAFAISLTAAVGGLVLVAGWTLTEHWIMWANRNLLLLNPLCLLLLPAWIASARAGWRPRRWQRMLAVLIAAGAALSAPLLLLPGAQHNLPWIALWLPAQLALAWSLTRTRTELVR